MVELTREGLEGLLDRIFPVVEPPEKRNPPMRGDDAAVDRRDDERYAVGVFIDALLEVEDKPEPERPAVPGPPIPPPAPPGRPVA